MPEACRRGRTQSKFWRGLAWCTHHIPGGQTIANVRRVHMKRARTCAARTPQLAHGMRARMQPDGRHDHARRRTTTRQSFAPGNGNDITHLQDHVVVDSKIFNARLRVLSCDVSGGADIVRQLLHSMFVGAVEVLFQRRPTNPTSPWWRKAGQERRQLVAPMFGALGLPPPSVGLPPQVDGATDASQGFHDEVTMLRRPLTRSLYHVHCT
jgi:hypothetical protein